MSDNRQLAIVTGAATGIGFALAQCCAEEGIDLLIAANERAIEYAAAELRQAAVEVEAVKCDLAEEEGVEKLYAAAHGRPVDMLFANARHGLGDAFLDQSFDRARHVIDTNITGTIYLIQKVGRDMRARRRGRILITGSIAGFIPGTSSAVYNGTKAFIDSFSHALRAELQDTGVTVTCLMPGATDTDFSKRAGMTDTRVGQQDKDGPAGVARTGFDAMMRGEGNVVSGWKNKIPSAAARATPAGLLVELYRQQAEMGSAKNK